jgi:hypothetical protein
MAQQTVSLTWSNLPQFRRALERYGVQKVARAGGALYREGERIMTAAKLRTPVDTGALRSSGLVSAPVTVGQSITVTLSFGGPAVPYALIVHEDLTARHVVGEAKYLEKSVREALPGLDARLAADLRG